MDVIAKRFILSVCLILSVLLPAAVRAGEPYTWQPVVIKGGGYIPGVYIHPANAKVVYLRTDMGGAYRLDPEANTWIPLLDWVGADDYSSLHGISSIALDPYDDNKVFMLTGMYTTSWGTNGAVLRSKDRGATWERTDLPFKADANMSGRWCGDRLALDPNDPSDLLIGTASGLLYKSTDGGVTFRQVTTFPKIEKNKYGLTSLAYVGGTRGQPTQTVYAGVHREGGITLFKSTDGGETWAEVPGGPGTAARRFMHRIVKDRDENLLIVYNNSADLNLGDAKPKEGWLYRLNTANDSWTLLHQTKGYGIGTVAVDPKDARRIMITSLAKWSGNIDLWRSDDGGKTWQAISVQRAREPAYITDGWPYPHWMTGLAISPDNPDHVLLCGVAGVYRTTTGTQNKQTWEFYSDGIEQCAMLDLICPPSGPTQVYSATYDVTGFRHDKLDVSSPDYAPEMDGTLDLDLAELEPNKMVRSTTSQPFGAYSEDAGAKWKAFKTPPEVKRGGDIAISADGAAIIWAPNGVKQPLRSTDGGQTWKPVAGLSKNGAPAADRKNANIIYVYVPGDGAVYRSTDQGVSFTLVGSNVPKFRKLIAHPTVEGDLWLGGDGGLVRSRDGGATWTPIDGVKRVRAISMGKSKDEGGYPAIYIAGKVGDADGVFRSDDAGKTWIEITDPQHQFGLVQAIAGDMRKFGRVYIGTNGRGIFYGDPKP